MEDPVKRPRSDNPEEELQSAEGHFVEPRLKVSWATHLCRGQNKQHIAADLEEVFHVEAKRGSAANDDLAAPTESSHNLAKDECVEKRRGLVVGKALIHVVALVADGVVE